MLEALFQLCDFVGRMLPQWLAPATTPFLLVPALLRLGFYPLWMIMIYATSLLANNLWAYLAMIAMAHTNGYFSTLAMMYGPSVVTAREQPVAGMLMVRLARLFPASALQ